MACVEHCGACCLSGRVARSGRARQRGGGELRGRCGQVGEHDASDRQRDGKAGGGCSACNPPPHAAPVDQRHDGFRRTGSIRVRSRAPRLTMWWCCTARAAAASACASRRYGVRARVAPPLLAQCSLSTTLAPAHTCREGMTVASRPLPR
eukprot:358961-Chlamydomonas_euryale.AAC.12